MPPDVVEVAVLENDIVEVYVSPDDTVDVEAYVTTTYEVTTLSDDSVDIVEVYAGVKGDQGLKGDKGDKGDQGIQGVPGNAATIAVGTVTTGIPGSAVVIVNDGTPQAAVLDFTIPRGDKGDKGDKGDQGIQGIQGQTGLTGARGSRWYSGQGAPPFIAGQQPSDQYFDVNTGNEYQVAADGVTWNLTGQMPFAPGNYVSKSGDTMLGTLTISGAPIVLSNLYPVYWNMPSGNQSYIAGNGTNLLLRGGSTGIAVRNNADTLTTVTISDAGGIFPAVGTAFPESTGTAAGSTVPGISFRNDGSAFIDSWVLHGKAVHAYGLARYAYDDGTGTGLAGNLAISGWGGLSLNTGNYEAVRINGGNHYVGIGMAPAVLLDVNGNARAKGLIVAPNQDATATRKAFDVYNARGVIGGTTVPTVQASLTVQFTAINDIGILVQPPAGQTSDLTQWTDSAGAVHTSIPAVGGVWTDQTVSASVLQASTRLGIYDAYSGIIGAGGARALLYGYHGIEVKGGRVSATVPSTTAGGGTTDASMYVYAPSATQTALQVKGFASQSADYMDIVDSAGYILVAYTTTGMILQHKANTSIEIGRVDGVGSTPFIDFHSGATVVDFDTRLIASGGDGTAGHGTLALSGKYVISTPGVSSAVGLTVLADSTLTGHGPEILLSDQKAGQATPKKYIRVNSGSLQVVNDGYTWTLLTLYDDGRMDINAGQSTGFSTLALYGDDSKNGRGSEIALYDTKAGLATPNKFIRNFAGTLQVINHAYTANLFTITDTGLTDLINTLRITSAGTPGLISVAYNGAPADNDQYGIVGVTALPNVNRAYYSMTANGVAVFGIGIGSDNKMRVGGVATGKTMGQAVTIDASGNITSPGTISDSSGRVYSPGNPPPATGGATVKAVQTVNSSLNTQLSTGSFYTSNTWIQVSSSVTFTAGAGGIAVLEYTFVGVSTFSGTVVLGVTAASSQTDASNTHSNGTSTESIIYVPSSGYNVTLSGKRYITGLTAGASYTYSVYAACNTGTVYWSYNTDQTYQQKPSAALVAITY